MDERPSFGDVLAVWSILLGYENLQENREQSEHNDVQKANDAQANMLLEELGRKFDEQNQMLREILEAVRNEEDQGDRRGDRG